MKKPGRFSHWVISNPLIAIAAALSVIFGFILAANNVMALILKGLHLPDCFTYASVYRSPWSYFKLEGKVWREYFDDDERHRYEFKEFSRTREDIVLQNVTPRDGMPNWDSLMVSLPVCGGTAKITTGTLMHWTDWVQIRREGTN